MAGGALLGLALVIPVASVVGGLMAPRTYRALNRLEVQPFQPDLLQPAFRDSLFGPNSTTRLVQLRSPSVIEVSSEALDPQEAAAVANAAAATIQSVLKERPGVTVGIVDTAQAPLRPQPPNLGRFVTRVGGITLLVALGAVTLLLVASSRRRGAEATPQPVA